SATNPYAPEHGLESLSSVVVCSTYEALHGKGKFHLQLRTKRRSIRRITCVNTTPKQYNVNILFDALYRKKVPPFGGTVNREDNTNMAKSGYPSRCWNKNSPMVS